MIGAGIGDAGLGLSPTTTMILRAHATRPMLLALAGVLLLLGLLAVTARADEYGGLGGLAVFKPGKNGGHLEVNPRSHHAFGVDPDGNSYIAEEIETEGKYYLRIQKLSSKGEYLTEARVELTGKPYQLDGVAIDAETQRLYVLVVGQRKGEGGGSVFDPEAPVAAALYAFSTAALEPAAGTPATGKEAGLLTGEKALGSLSEAAGVPLLDPHGIAVDPTTHDVLILGQQDMSAKKGLGEEDLGAAVQRVHTEGAAEGELGPRYVDAQNCLDEGAEIETEPACGESFGQPTSPFVSSGGRLYGERAGELWEIPATENASEAFTSAPKVYEAKPKRLFTMGPREAGAIVELASMEEGEGGALAFVPTGPGEGRIYLDAKIISEEGEGNRTANRGAAVLSYSESGGTPVAKELGWTAGQNGTGEKEKCILPLGSPQVLVGADSGGGLLLLDITYAGAPSEHKPATVNVLQFGTGGEECGHARATPPSVSVKGQPVTTLKAGQNTSLALDVFAADTNSVEWKFLDNGKEEPDEPPVVESYPFPTQVPTLTHEFKHGGNYEILATVEPDDFGPKIEEHANVTVEGEEGGSGSGGSPIGAEFSYTSPATVGQPAQFAAKVTDPSNKGLPRVQYKYVWEFGDGAKIEGGGGREFRTEHAYAGEGRYVVKLTVIDEGGRTTEAMHAVQVNVARTPASTASSSTGGSGGSGDSGGGGASIDRGVSGVTSTRAPDATLAGTTSLVVGKSGGVTLKLACPAGETRCAGTVTLRTLGAVKASTRGKKHVLILAAGSFAVAGGRLEAVTLHLSAMARALLARMHVLRVQATIEAHDPAGATHTTPAVVTLRLGKHVNKR
jgi:PKD repeat protein